MSDKSDPVLEEFVSNALLRFEANLNAALPRTAPQLRRYLQGVPAWPEHVFAVRNYPHFLLPYWFSPSANRIADVEFQTDLIYSSLNGYYSVRLCDNIADNDSPPELRKLAPCILYFACEAIRPYRKHFSATDEFWHSLDTFLALQAEASAADSFLKDVGTETFASLSSRKFTGTKIPMSAVHCRYPALKRSFEQWLLFVDCLSNFAQFNNDFFDWRHDSIYGIVTYISSEWRRQAPGASITEWFLREGFDWGVGELKLRFENVRLRGEELGNEAVVAWLIARRRALDDDIGRVLAGLNVLKTFGRVISGQ
jgi:hypothetical protein